MPKTRLARFNFVERAPRAEESLGVRSFFSHEGTKGTKVFGEAGLAASRRLRVASPPLIATTQWRAILRVKALLCFSPREAPAHTAAKKNHRRLRQNV
jgi:hypothetical protein